MGRADVRTLLPGVALALVGCGGLVPAAARTASFGHPDDGVLFDGVAMPIDGEGYVLARPGDPTRFGTRALVATLARAAQSVARAYPGGAPLKIGDLSSPFGGRHERHHSHRTGRDVDLVFFLTDAAGASVPGRGSLRFDESGVATGDAEAGIGPSPLFFFDDARNWHLVRALLTDPEAPVQWIFCSAGVKARLLRHAAAVEADPDVLFRAAWVLHEPSNGRVHDDHFHVRIACSAVERVAGCLDRGPLWAWHRPALEKPPTEAVTPLPDEAVVEALLVEPDEAVAQWVARGAALM